MRFAISEYDVPAIPSLPRRCPAEGMIAQAVVGINGVTAGQYGSIAVDPAAVDPYAPVITDVATDSFSGLRRFLDHAVAVGLDGPVKWQFVGPVTLGVALARAGLADDVAFAVAARPCGRTSSRCRSPVAAALPRRRRSSSSTSRGSPNCSAPGSRSPPTRRSTCCRGRWRACPGWPPSGVHCCGAADVASLLAAGPDVLSIPARPPVTGAAGYLGRFLDGGGRIAWGVVATDGPMFVSPDRQWRELIDAVGGDRATRRRRRSCCASAASSRSLRPRPAHAGRRRTGVPGRARDRPPHRRVGVRGSVPVSDDVTEAEIRAELPEARWSRSPSSSATTTAGTTSSTTRRSPTATSTPSCASCAPSPRRIPTSSSTTRWPATSAARRARCSLRCPTPSDDEPRQRDDREELEAWGARVAAACPTRR